MVFWPRYNWNIVESGIKHYKSYISGWEGFKLGVKIP
jgi:hypothetical protein